MSIASFQLETPFLPSTAKKPILLPTEAVESILNQLDLPTLFRLATEPISTEHEHALLKKQRRNQRPSTIASKCSAPFNWLRQLHSNRVAIKHAQSTLVQEGTLGEMVDHSSTVATPTTNTTIQPLVNTHLRRDGLRYCARRALIRHFVKRPPILIIRFGQENARAYHIAFCLRAIHPTTGRLLFTPMLATGLRYTYSAMTGMPQCRGDGLEEWCYGWSAMLPTPKYASLPLSATSSNETNETNHSPEITSKLISPQAWKEYQWQLVAPQDMAKSSPSDSTSTNSVSHSPMAAPPLMPPPPPPITTLSSTLRRVARLPPPAVAPDTYSIRRRYQRQRLLASTRRLSLPAETISAPTPAPSRRRLSPRVSRSNLLFPSLSNGRRAGFFSSRYRMPITRPNPHTLPMTSNNRNSTSSTSTTSLSQEEELSNEWPSFGWHARLPVKNEGTVIVPVKTNKQPISLKHRMMQLRVDRQAETKKAINQLEKAIEQDSLGSLAWFFHHPVPSSFASLNEQTMAVMKEHGKDQWAAPNESHGLLRYTVRRQRPNIGPPPTFPRPRRSGERWIIPEGFVCDIGALVPPPTPTTTNATPTTATLSAPTTTVPSVTMPTSTITTPTLPVTANNRDSVLQRRRFNWLKYRSTTANVNNRRTITSIFSNTQRSNGSSTATATATTVTTSEPVVQTISAPNAITASERILSSLADVVRQTMQSNSSSRISIDSKHLDSSDNLHDSNLHHHHHSNDDDHSALQSSTPLWISNGRRRPAPPDHTQSAPSTLQYNSLSPSLF
ncbi:hypothetical protein BDF19DRAFT_422554 [Syncephalis fuscata]|nr:hypothetical protein BDF19DRAFT_422554 [Syncephalis fuscata]